MATMLTLKNVINLLQKIITSHYLLICALGLGLISFTYDDCRTKCDCFLNPVFADQLTSLYTQLFYTILITHLLSRILKTLLDHAENQAIAASVTDPIRRVLALAPTLNPSIEIPNIIFIRVLILAICVFSFCGVGLLGIAIGKLVLIKVWSLRCTTKYIVLDALFVLKYFPQSGTLFDSLIRFMLDDYFRG